MGGGLMQLVAYGAQDIYLTGNPQITFFKVVYRRHTNFSMETIQQTINGTPSSGGSSTVTVSRNGDLIHKVYVTNNSASVVDGSKIVAQVELEIGGQLIDRQTAEWNDIWNELTVPAGKRLGFRSMQHCLHTPEDKSVGMTQVPLNFWFCRNPGLSLPLIALQYHEVKIKIKWGNTTVGHLDYAGEVASAKLWVDYIYLDTDERRRFAQVSHEYLIEQVQKQSATANSSNKLNFNHPVKELIWTSQAGTTAYGTALLKLNGHDRFAAQEEEYFQLRQPFEYHTSIPHQNLPVAPASRRGPETLTKHGGAIFVEAAGLDTTALLTTKINLVTIGGSSAVLTDVPADDAVIAAATTSASAFLIGNTNGASCIKPGTLTQGTKLKITIHDSSAAQATGVPDVTFDATINFLCSNSAVTNAGSQGTNGPLKSHTRMDKRTMETGEESIDDAVIIVILDSVMTFASLETGEDTVHIEKVGDDEAETSHMRKKINVYSFALKPEEHQPSGTCNFSRIDNARLDFSGTALSNDENIYAVNYNVLRIMSGMGGLAYSN
jgi:hypothetical protein